MNGESVKAMFIRKENEAEVLKAIYFLDNPTRDEIENGIESDEQLLFAEMSGVNDFLLIISNG